MFQVVDNLEGISIAQREDSRSANIYMLTHGMLQELEYFGNKELRDLVAKHITTAYQWNYYGSTPVIEYKSAIRGEVLSDLHLFWA